MLYIDTGSRIFSKKSPKKLLTLYARGSIMMIRTRNIKIIQARRKVEYERAKNNFHTKKKRPQKKALLIITTK